MDRTTPPSTRSAAPLVSGPGPSVTGWLLHQLDLAGVVYLDVGPVLPADHHPTNSNGLALVVGGWVVDSCFGEFLPPIFGDDHPQVLRVTVVRLGVEEDLP